MDYLRNRLGDKELKKVFYILITLAAGAVFALVVGLTMLGVVAPWSGRFYSLWDTGQVQLYKLLLIICTI